MPILVESMPMKASRLVAKIVVDVDNKVVSEINVYLRAWPLTINPNDRPWESSIGVPGDPVNAPVIGHGLCHCKLARGQQKESQRKHDG